MFYNSKKKYLMNFERHFSFQMHNFFSSENMKKSRFQQQIKVGSGNPKHRNNFYLALCYQLQTNALTCIKKSRDDTDILDKLLSSANSLLSKNQEALTKHEEYLKQYGYIPQGLIYMYHHPLSGFAQA